MPYRSERFPAGELKGLEKAWEVIDGLETSGLSVAAEVMSGTSYRRQLHPANSETIGEVNYVLQAVLSVPKRDDGKRISASYFVDESRKILSAVEAPGDIDFDEGRFIGPNSALPFGSTGRTEDDVITIYAPWLSSRWTEASKSCMFYCGIEPPQPKSFMEDYGVSWSEQAMRKGMVVFRPTPPEPQEL